MMGFEGIIMSWQPHPKFKSGQYRAVVEVLLDRPNSATARKRYIASLIASLSFLGRIEEASDLYDLVAKKSKNPSDRIASRFYLAIGFTRRSEYSHAQKLFEQNEKEAGKSAIDKFFVHQGRVFFRFYTGRLAGCLAEARSARKWAVASKDLLARGLATDALGLVQLREGEIHAGLQHLREAERLALRLGNKNTAGAIRITAQLYEWEFGLQTESLAELEAAFRAEGPENNFSHASLGLELARQHTVRGNFAAASRVLEQVAPDIYGSQNRRQEILLNLRLAELAGRRGEFFQSRHFLWFCRRLLHREVDGTFELAALGIERKLALAEGLSASGIEKKWGELAEYSSTRDRNLKVRLGFLGAEKENPEDKVHSILRRAQLGSSPEARLAPLLEAGFLAEAALALGLPPGPNSLAILPKGFLVQNKEGISWKPEALSSLQHKLCRVLGTGQEVSKGALVQRAWGYTYDSLRHDSMVYAALSALRKTLGPAGAWLHPTENGYRLEAKVIWGAADNSPNSLPAPAKDALVADDLVARFNHRQIEILEWIRTVRFVSVNDCRKKFGVSEITALRDIGGLRREGYVVRIGKARATRYGLAKGDPS
jgi:DNA-binding winged helix-turn-helix (wHTH) protein